MSGFSPNLNPVGSHVIPLVQSLGLVGGPVLELGAGMISTSLIHGMLFGTGRKIFTLEEHPSWVILARKYENNYHQIRGSHGTPEEILEVMKEFEVPHWGVCLVDHELWNVDGNYERRKDVVRELRDKCDILVVHDTEDFRFTKDSVWKEIDESFKYRWVYDEVLPSTTVLSNFVDVRRRKASPLDAVGEQAGKLS